MVGGGKEEKDDKEEEGEGEAINDRNTVITGLKFNHTER